MSTRFPPRLEDRVYGGEIDLGSSHYLRFFRHGEPGATEIQTTHGPVSIVDQPTLTDGTPASGGIIRHKAIIFIRRPKEQDAFPAA